MITPEYVAVLERKPAAVPAHLKVSEVLRANLERMLKTDRLFYDETTTVVLAPGTKKTRKDDLWAVMRDQRGWGSADPPIIAFQHSRSRSAETAKDIFKDYTAGVPTVGGYAAYNNLADPKKNNKNWHLSFCWTHWQRSFVELSLTTPWPSNGHHDVLPVQSK